MATWGPMLNADDSFREVIETFQSRFHNGIPVDQILTQIQKEMGGGIDDHIIQLALLECLWRVNKIRQKDLVYIEAIIKTNKDQEYWMMLGADKAFLEKRLVELNKFFEKISHPPLNKQIWKISTQQRQLEKGCCFWYRHKKGVYGALVLEVQKDIDCCYYLIAISELLNNIPTTVEGIIGAPIYTIAWFTEESLLNNKRMHYVGCTNISSSFENRYGLHIQKGRSVSLANCGQAYTWSHLYRIFSFQNKTISDILN